MSSNPSRPVNDSDNTKAGASRGGSIEPTLPMPDIAQLKIQTFEPQFAGYNNTYMENQFYETINDGSIGPALQIDPCLLSPNENEPGSSSSREPIGVYTKEQVRMWHPYATPVICGDSGNGSSDTVDHQQYVGISKTLRQKLEEIEVMLTTNALYVKKAKYEELLQFCNQAMTDAASLGQYTKAFTAAKSAARSVRISTSSSGTNATEGKKAGSSVSSQILAGLNAPGSRHSTSEEEMGSASNGSASGSGSDNGSDRGSGSNSSRSGSQLSSTKSAKSTSAYSDVSSHASEQPHSAPSTEKVKQEPASSRAPVAPVRAPQYSFKAALAARIDEERYRMGMVVVDTYVRDRDIRNKIAQYNEQLAFGRGKFRENQVKLAKENKPEYTRQLSQLSIFDRYVVSSFSGAVRRSKQANDKARKFALVRTGLHRRMNNEIATLQWQQLSWNVNGNITDDFLWLATFFREFDMTEEQTLMYDEMYRCIVFADAYYLPMEMPIDEITLLDPSLNVEAFKAFLRRRAIWIAQGPECTDDERRKLSPAENELVAAQNKVEGLDPIRAKAHWKAIEAQLIVGKEPFMQKLVSSARSIAEIPSHVLAKDAGCLIHVAAVFLFAHPLVSEQDSILIASISYLLNAFSVPVPQEVPGTEHAHPNPRP